MNTELYMLTETSEFMMSFVIVTKKNNVIIKYILAVFMLKKMLSFNWRSMVLKE